MGKIYSLCGKFAERAKQKNKETLQLKTKYSLKPPTTSYRDTVWCAGRTLGTKFQVLSKSAKVDTEMRGVKICLMSLLSSLHFIILHLHLHYLKVLLAHTVFVISHQTRSQNVLASSMKIIKRTGGGPECATLAK